MRHYARMECTCAHLQPPLSYYTAVLNSRPWERVDIVTYALLEEEQNPVLPELQIMIDTGSWPRTDINIYTASIICL